MGVWGTEFRRLPAEPPHGRKSNILAISVFPKHQPQPSNENVCLLQTQPLASQRPFMSSQNISPSLPQTISVFPKTNPSLPKTISDINPSLPRTMSVFPKHSLSKTISSMLALKRQLLSSQNISPGTLFTETQTVAFLTTSTPAFQRPLLPSQNSKDHCCLPTSALSFQRPFLSSQNTNPSLPRPFQPSQSTLAFQRPYLSSQNINPSLPKAISVFPKHQP